MSALFIMIGASLIIAIGFLAAFLWAVRKGQYEDDYSPAVRILFDSELTSSKESKKESTNTTDDK
ncbi:MAG: cbb3-type cytochrome oxidase assembly protein CcoS [Flavobacteriales bacterium]|nr:cbb3-type cytochrome oxidase assembly protein CcoS [Flavobacteriales bacterium]